MERRKGKSAGSTAISAMSDGEIPLPQPVRKSYVDDWTLDGLANASTMPDGETPLRQSARRLYVDDRTFDGL